MDFVKFNIKMMNSPYRERGVLVLAVAAHEVHVGAAARRGRLVRRGVRALLVRVLARCGRLLAFLHFRFELESDSSFLNALWLV